MPGFAGMTCLLRADFVLNPFLPAMIKRLQHVGEISERSISEGIPDIEILVQPKLQLFFKWLVSSSIKYDYLRVRYIRSK